jgi:ParB-like chromosome segregation protein Spo0J
MTDTLKCQHKIIALNEIKPPRYEVRKKPELELMIQLGPIHTMLLTPRDEGHFKFEIISGEQWYDLYLEIDAKLVPATIIQGNEYHIALAVASAELCSSNQPVKTARVLKTLLKYHNVIELGKILGYKSSSIHDMTKILELPNDIIPLIPEQLAYGVARNLINTDNDTKKRCFEHLREGKILTNKDLTFLKHQRGDKLKKVVEKWIKPDYQPLLEIGFEVSR